MVRVKCGHSFLLFMSALLLGLIGGCIPGPVLAATFARVLQRGLPAAVLLILWAAAVEASVALVSMQLLQIVPANGLVFRLLSGVGAGVLLWIVYGVWNIRTLDARVDNVLSLKQVTLMILSNGALWTFWVTVCTPQALAWAREWPGGQYAFLFLFEVGWISATVAMALLFCSARRWLSHPKIVPVFFRGCAMAFVFFALSALWSAVR